jgi:hypothetical protein
VRYIAIACIFLLSTSRLVLAAPTRQIDVAVAAPAGVSDALLNGIFTEAAAIWTSADVEFRWHRSLDVDTTRSDYLLVTFEPSAARRLEANAPLGWILFEKERPSHTIHLAPSNAESLIHRTPFAHDATVAEHEALLGRALGRAFAHEAGHYLLRSKTHAAHGLMRAAWPAEQVLAPDRAGFLLATDEQAAIRSTSHGWSWSGAE